MSGKVKDLLVKILVDDSEVGKFQKAGQTAISFGNVMDKAAVASAATLAGLAGAAVAVGNAASDAEQASGAVESIFKGQSDRIRELAENTHDAVTLSSTDYMNLAAVLGGQLKNMGVAVDDLVPQTEGLIALGADMAATFGGTTAEAVQAISSLLRGERDPIERYAVGIKDWNIQAKLAAMGLGELEGAERQAAETQAVLALLTEQTADAHGQAAREADTAAGAQARMNEAIGTASAKIGEVMLPIMAGAASGLAGFANWAGENAELVQGLAIGLGILAGSILVVNGAMKAMAVVQAIAGFMGGLSIASHAAGGGMQALGAGIKATGIGALVVAITTVIAALVTWFATTEDGQKAWAGFMGFLGDAWTNITGFIGQSIDWIGQRVGDIGGFFASIPEGIGNAWRGLVGFIKDWVVNPILTAVEFMANGVIFLVNGMIDGINAVAGWTGLHLDRFAPVSIPKLATGGIVTSPTLALIGEAGPEAVVPLSQGSTYGLGSADDRPIVIENVLKLDGNVLLRSLRKLDLRAAY